MHILVVEDDVKISRLISEGLKAQKFDVEAAFDGARGLELALTGRFDLLILDLMLPQLSGIQLLESLREHDKSTLVIALTALSDVSDRVTVLDLGADDYLIKPFSFVELQARIRSLLRRSDRTQETILQVGGLRLDPIKRSAHFGRRSTELSDREFRLLEYLFQSPGEPVTRAMIIDRVWGYQFDTGTNIIDVYINYLRKKLSSIGLEPIKTMRGIGYFLDVDACKPTEPQA